MGKQEKIRRKKKRTYSTCIYFVLRMMGTHQWHLAWLTYNCCTESSYTPPPVDLAPIPHQAPITLYYIPELLILDSMWYTKHYEVDTKEQVARHNQPNMSEYIYIPTTNRQQNTQIQYPRHRKKPWINTAQATTTAVLKIKLLYGILHHYQRT